MSKYKQTFAEAYKNIYESAAAREIDRTNTRKDSMDYQMYKKSAELLRKKDYKALGKHIHKSDTAPREYVMDVISKKEPATFKKIYGNQTGFLATMKPLSMGEAAPDPITYGPDKVAKAMAIAVKSDGQYSKAVKDIEKIAKDLSKVSTIARALKTANEDLDAQPQERDVKKVKGTQPKKK